MHPQKAQVSTSLEIRGNKTEGVEYDDGFEVLLHQVSLHRMAARQERVSGAVGPTTGSGIEVGLR